MAYTIEIEGNESIKIKCATCSNGIPLFRCLRFPICDDCLKDLREIIEERRANVKRIPPVYYGSRDYEWMENHKNVNRGSICRIDGEPFIFDGNDWHLQKGPNGV